MSVLAGLLLISDLIDQAGGRVLLFGLMIGTPLHVLSVGRDSVVVTAEATQRSRYREKMTHAAAAGRLTAHNTKWMQYGSYFGKPSQPSEIFDVLLRNKGITPSNATLQSTQSEPDLPSHNDVARSTPW